MRLSLGAILAASLAGLQLLAVLSVVLSSYLTSERTLLNHARTLLSDLGANVIEHSKGFLKPARGTAELAKRLAEHEIIASDNPRLLEKLLFQQLQVAPQFSSVYYGDEMGNFVFVARSEDIAPYRAKIVRNDNNTRTTELIWRDDGYNIVSQYFDPSDNYDPRVRPWYVSAKKQRTSIWTDPYIFFSSKRPGITVASPVIGPNGLRGVIGVDIEIEAISHFLSNLRIGENGAVMILNNKGQVIAHPNSELIKIEHDDGSLSFTSIDKINDPVAKAAFGELGKLTVLTLDHEIKSDFSHGGNDYVSTLIPVNSDELPWTVAIYAPEDAFIGEIKSNRTRNIWIAAAIALATGLIGLLLANKILKPVRDFANRAELATQFIGPEMPPLPTTYPELEKAGDTLAQEIAQRKMSEREYGLTFEMASRGMTQVSLETGRFIRVNSQLEDIIGYSADEMLEMTFEDILHFEENQNHVSFKDSIQDGFEYNKENRYVHKNGSQVWLRVNAILILNDVGKPLHAVATVHDITARKISEEKITELSRDLSHHTRVNMMSQMAAGLAHELNQPLTAITQNVDAALLTIKDDENTDAELVEILHELDQQAHRGGDIIRALRGFVTKDEGEKIAFDFAELMDQASRLVHPEAIKHDIDILFKSKAHSFVIGNRIQIAQVVVNLLRNAIEAMSTTKKTSNGNAKKIVVTSTHKDEMIKICVQDNGPGIDKRIDLFTQFETSKKDGMGLGLSFSRSIIEENGGTLWHDTEFKKGSRFCFTLNIALKSTHQNNDDAMKVEEIKTNV